MHCFVPREAVMSWRGQIDNLTRDNVPVLKDESDGYGYFAGMYNNGDHAASALTFYLGGWSNCAIRVKVTAGSAGRQKTTMGGLPLVARE